MIEKAEILLRNRVLTKDVETQNKRLLWRMENTRKERIWCSSYS